MLADIRERLVTLAFPMHAFEEDSSIVLVTEGGLDAGHGWRAEGGGGHAMSSEPDQLNEPLQGSRDQRRYPRHNFRIIAMAEWTTPPRDGRPRTRSVEVLDIGAGGVRFLADHEILRGERLILNVEVGTADDRLLRVPLDVRWSQYHLPPGLGRHTCGAA